LPGDHRRSRVIPELAALGPCAITKRNIIYPFDSTKVLLWYIKSFRWWHVFLFCAHESCVSFSLSKVKFVLNLFTIIGLKLRCHLKIDTFVLYRIVGPCAFLTLRSVGHLEPCTLTQHFSGYVQSSSLRHEGVHDDHGTAILVLPLESLCIPILNSQRWYLREKRNEREISGGRPRKIVNYYNQKHLASRLLFFTLPMNDNVTYTNSVNYVLSYW